MQRQNFHGLSKAGVFYRDRDEWMRFVLSRTELDRSVRMVGVAIVLRMNPKSPESYPQQTTIAKELGVSVPTVKRAVAKLVGEKLLSATKRKRKNARRAVNHYRMIHPADPSE